MVIKQWGGSMHEHFQFTVADVLKRKHFEKAKVIAGHQGMHRIVKWVHVVEVTNIHHLLRGKELILSTGVGWKENESLLLSFLQQLIECDASGLCIEIGTYTSSIPQEVIQLADAHQFPILLFLQEVPFVEITQDIHTHLINRHYQMIANLEAYSQQLNKKLLSIDHYYEILKFLHHYLGHQVLFQMNGKEVQFVPECSEKKKREWLAYAEQSSKQTASQAIQLFHNDYARLSILSTAQEISEFDLLILDRTATAIAQHLLRDLYVEEKKRLAEQEWLKGWVEGEHSPQAIAAYFTEHAPQVKPKGGVVVLCKFPSAKRLKDVTYFLLLFRTIFEQQGFHLFSVQLRHSLLFIFINTRDTHTWKVRMQAGIDRLLQSEFMQKKLSIGLSVGKFVDNLASLPKSYQTAQETSRLQQRLGKKMTSYFYEDLHMARIVSLLDASGHLRDMVNEYLAPIIQYDEKHNGKLLETLKVYLACNGSKKETAERLFIVRQTLYHRLQKLEQLLGDDFMHPEKRLALECMIYAYEYLPDLLE